MLMANVMPNTTNLVKTGKQLPPTSTIKIGRDDRYASVGCFFQVRFTSFSSVLPSVGSAEKKRSLKFYFMLEKSTKPYRLL